MPGVELSTGIQVTADISCVADREMVVIATPSFAVRQTAEKLQPYLPAGCTVVCVSKGVEEDGFRRFSQVLEEVLGPQVPIVVLSGPSHAEEVGRGVPTACVSASKTLAVAELVQDTFMNERFRVYTTTDVVGVELCATLKNIIALCAGVCDGLGYGDNTVAALMTRGLAEMARLGVALGGRKETFAGLAGLGDLVVTCTSRHSRNRRAGVLIGSGLPVAAAIEKVGTVEGYFATKAAYEEAVKLGVDMPITVEAYRVLYEEKDPRQAMRELMCRPKRSEPSPAEETWVN